MQNYFKVVRINCFNIPDDLADEVSTNRGGKTHLGSIDTSLTFIQFK